MSRPADHNTLLTRIDTDFAKLLDQTALVPAADRTKTGACEQWSAKDTLAHLDAWHGLFLWAVKLIGRCVKTLNGATITVEKASKVKAKLLAKKLMINELQKMAGALQHVVRQQATAEGWWQRQKAFKSLKKVKEVVKQIEIQKT